MWAGWAAGSSRSRTRHNSWISKILLRARPDRAFNHIATAVRNGTPPGSIPVQPFFQNQIADFIGVPSALLSFFGPPELVHFRHWPVASLSQYFLNGDITDFMVAMNNFGLIAPNIGIDAQAASIGYVSSKSSSSYNGMLVILRKKFSNGLQMDFNYTLSHSIDDLSSVVNTVLGGLICDLRNLRACRANSDFDATHIVSANWVYDLPFGHGRYIGKDMPGWANHIVGGWSFSGIWTWRTGFPMSTATGSFPVSNYLGGGSGAPAVLTGSMAGTGGSIHNENGALQYFANPATVLEQFSNPLAGQSGSRNDLRGPGYWTIDAALLKNITLTERLHLQFRAEAFNLFNGENFNPPGTNINSSTFGVLSSTTGEGARQMQFALRLEF